MDTNDEAVPSTARLNFGQKVEQDTKAEVQAEEAQQEAMTAEAEEQPEATVEAVSDAPVVETEAQTETSDAEPVDAPEAPVEEAYQIAESEGKSVEELVAERDRIDAEVKAKQNALKASVIDQIKTVVNTYDISTEELVEALGGLKSKRKGIKAKPKYKDPATGVIWSGRGKEPAWIKGQDRSKFLIPEA